MAFDPPSLSAGRARQNETKGQISHLFYEGIIMKRKGILLTAACVLLGLTMMLTSCQRVLVDPRHLRAAAVYESCDGAADGPHPLPIGQDEDIAKLERMLHSGTDITDSYHPDDVTMTIDGTEYTLQFSEVKRSRSDIDWEVDVYKLNQGDLHISVTFAHGDTKTPIGYKFVSEETHWMYDDP